MIVKPGLEIHPKFIGLARQVGGDGKALLILYRLWEHCQVVKKGEFWGRVSVAYVESIARWRGKAGVCFEALRYPLGREEQGASWVVVDAEGGVTIHGWDDANRGLLSARVNGAKGGRPSGSVPRHSHNPPVNRSDNPPDTGRLSGAEPTRARREWKGMEGSGVPPTPCPSEQVPGGELKKTGDEESGTRGPRPSEDGEEAEIAEVPTVGEMFEFFQARGQGVPLRTCENYARWAERKRVWIMRDGRGQEFVRDWRKEVAEWAVKDRQDGGGEGAMGTARREQIGTTRGTSRFAAGPTKEQEEAEAIEAELQWQKDAARVAVLKKRWKEIKG